MKLSSTMLRAISQEVLNGNPWWGMAVANEYLSGESPLLKAVANQFKIRIGAAAHSPLAHRLLAGQRFAELPLNLQDEVGGRLVKRPREISPVAFVTPISNKRRPLKQSPCRRRMVSRRRVKPLSAARAALKDAHIVVLAR